MGVNRRSWLRGRQCFSQTVVLDPQRWIDWQQSLTTVWGVDHDEVGRGDRLIAFGRWHAFTTCEVAS